MISEPLLHSIIGHLKTTDSMYTFLFELDKVHDSLFKSGSISNAQVVENNMSQEHALFLHEHIVSMNSEQLSVFLKELEDELKKVQKYGITLAFKYDAAFASTLFDWISQNTTGHYLLDITYDPEIIGGGVFIYDGLYKDFSLRKVLSSFFESKDGLQKLI